MNRREHVMQLVATLRDSVTDGKEMFDELTTLLLSYFEEPVQPTGICILLKTPSGTLINNQPLQLGLSSKDAERVEIANLQTIVGAGFVPICVLSTGRWNTPNGPMTFIRAYDDQHTFFAEWIGSVENARPVFGPTSIRFSQWFKAEHDTAASN